MRNARVRLCLAFAALSTWAASPSDVEDDIRQGRLLQSQGRLAEAEQQFQAALSKPTQVPLQPELQAAALSGLAGVEIDLVHNDLAARLYNRAIGMLQKAGGHLPEIENIRVQLAEVYLQGGETDTAEKLVQSAIASQKVRHSADTPEAAFALDIQACISAFRKNFRAAETAEREALSILYGRGRQSGPEYAVSTLHLASFLNSQKRPADALPYAQTALTLLHELPVPLPAMEGASEITLASIYSVIGRNEDALNAAEAGIQKVRAYYGANHPGTASTLLAEAAILRRIGRKTEARRAQKEGEMITAATRGAGVSDTVPLQALLPR